jgi:phage FluMu protein Com
VTLPARAEQPKLIEVRCKACGRLLFKADTSQGKVEIVCPGRGCRRMQTITLPRS